MNYNSNGTERRPGQPSRQQNTNGRGANTPAARPASRPDVRPAQNSAMRPAIRAAQKSTVKRAPSPYYSYNSGSGVKMRRRRRRPTVFTVILIVFIVALLTIIFTSKNFRNMINSFGDDTAADTGQPDTEPAQTDNAAMPDTAPDTTPDTIAPPEDDSFLICIDPGHGFGDVGTSSPNLGEWDEKDVTFAVATEIYNILKESGYNVVLSHDNKTIPVTSIDDGNNLFYIDERSVHANDIGTDLFVSIHCDTFDDDTGVHGTRVYYCSEYEYSDSAAVLTDKIASKIDAKFTGAKKVITYGRDSASAFYVTQNVKAPSALIELGFISNPDDAAKMCDEGWRRDIAEAIADAVGEYVRENENK